MSGTVYMVSIEVRVDDERALLDAARAQAKKEGSHIDLLEDGEPDVHACLITLLDPGQIADGTAGAEILGTSVEATPHFIAGGG